MVHLLEGAALGFRHEKESPYSREHTKHSEEHVRSEPGVLDERGSNETLSWEVSICMMEIGTEKKRETHDDKVVEPVGAGG